MTLTSILSTPIILDSVVVTTNVDENTIATFTVTYDNVDPNTGETTTVTMDKVE